MKANLVLSVFIRPKFSYLSENRIFIIDLLEANGADVDPDSTSTKIAWHTFCKMP